MIVAPIAAALIQMAISRSREFQADRTAARMIGDGEPLAAALEKLDVASRAIPSLANANQAQMYIANPLAGRKMAFRNLFTTHPPMDKRISRLRDRSWQEVL
jgi:heat shock protein HtpX